jgi:shikimate kinase
VRYEWNRDALRGTGVIVLLEADLVTLAERVRAADRPRVNPDATLEEDLARIWSGAAELYRGAADIVYRTDTGRSIEQEVEDLVRLLGPRRGYP